MRASVLPDGKKIAELRLLKMWSQAEAAEEVGLKYPANISRIERGMRVRAETLKEVLQALLAVERPVVEEVFRDYVIPDIQGGEDPGQWLWLAIERDRQGNHGRAIEIGEHLLGQVRPRALRTEVRVRLATFYDHASRWECALGVLDLIVGPGSTRPPRDDLWVLYQRAVVQRRYAEDLIGRCGHRLPAAARRLLSSAEKDLREVRRHGERDHQVSADHQLGVLDLVGGRPREALKKFQSCLKRRQEDDGARPQQPEAAFRRAYEHRRIAQCHAMLGQKREAARHFNAAVDLAVSSEHQRLLLELRRDGMAFGLKWPERGGH